MRLLSIRTLLPATAVALTVTSHALPGNSQIRPQNQQTGRIEQLDPQSYRLAQAANRNCRRRESIELEIEEGNRILKEYKDLLAKLPEQLKADLEEIKKGSLFRGNSILQTPEQVRNYYAAETQKTQQSINSVKETIQRLQKSIAGC